MFNHINKLKKYIEECNDIQSSIKSDIFDYIKGIKTYQKELEKASRIVNFKLDRVLKDKKIIINVLNQTIDELQEKTDNLSKQKKLLEEESKFKEQLFANVSHELRTPLHGILGMSHLLQGNELDLQQKKYVSVIQSSADNLLAIVNDLLSLSQMNEGQAKLQLQAFSTKDFFNQLRQLIKNKIEEKSLQLSFTLSPKLPAQVIGDKARVTQILLHILNNAIKFTNKGSVSLHCSILALQNNNIQLKFDIKDTGIGIPQNKLAAIFDNFSKAYESSSYDGFGLGLTIVQNLLKLMKGYIDVQSTLGQGSTFSVVIPFSVPEEIIKQQETIDIDEEVQEVPAYWLQKKIIYIEDNKANILYAKHIFSNWNMEIDVVENIQEAVFAIGQKAYDCILSDVKLPDGNGIQFIKRMRLQLSTPNTNTPVIVLTAGASTKEKQLAKTLNISSYICKPFPPIALKEALAKVLKPLPNQTGNIGSSMPCSQNIPTICNQIIKNPIINVPTNYLAKLHKTVGGKKKYMVEMIDIFLEQIPIVLKGIEKSIKKVDWEQVHFHAHKIKSTINIIGLTELQPLIITIDDYSRHNKNVEQIPSLFTTFSTKAREDITKLEQARKDLLTALQA